MNKKYTKQDVILGSGDLYCLEYTDTIPTNEEIEVENNLLGAIKGGAVLTYTPTYFTDSSDKEDITVRILQAEDVSFKSGIMTIIGETYTKIVQTARVTEQDGITIVKIGGIKNFDNKTYIFHFKNTDKARPARVTVVGMNEKGFEMQFKKDASTVIDLEIKGESLDNEGTKVILQLGEKTTSVQRSVK